MPARTPRTLRPSSSEGAAALLERAIAFERECLALVADDRREHPLGLWTRSAEHPQLWSLNQLHVIGRHPELTAEQLMAELDRGLADVRHRRVVVDDDATGRRLQDDFRKAGWSVGPVLVMVLDREPPVPPVAVAHEIDAPGMDTLDELIMHDDDEIPEHDRPIVLAAHAHMRRAIPGTREFAGVRDGVDACQATLYTDGRTGQVESVGTLRAHRGHGLAAATVGLAAREALAAGCDLVFIVCHADTGPVALYAGLGFRPAGRFWTFTRPA
ncbi:MAG: family N-acetyltransferase [Solirubrobacteraceae bacterium]|nr:family N-acetyltransferase [Solirubrobacteraceae bacterium]